MIYQDILGPYSVGIYPQVELNSAVENVCFMPIIRIENKTEKSRFTKKYLLQLRRMIAHF